MVGSSFSPPFAAIFSSPFMSPIAVHLRLPLDLERMIFEVAVEDRDSDMTALAIMLVAQRCRAWIEPLLYRTLVIDQGSWGLRLLLRTLEANPLHYARHIKCIRIEHYFARNEKSVGQLLSLCPQAVHLVDLSYGPTPIRHLALERICASRDTLLGCEPQAGSLSRLTHLHLLDPPHYWTRIPYTDLPSLTHLALQNYRADIRLANVPRIQEILQRCSRLERLVVVIPISRQQDHNARQILDLVDDGRLRILASNMSQSYKIWIECGERQLSFIPAGDEDEPRKIVQVETPLQFCPVSLRDMTTAFRKREDEKKNARIGMGGVEPVRV
ncbi:unnamed protein product [Mycena citricolor]|uniref:Uncharacterized protein n=1 Tax=Mycena citricolor TaxID=2018698 RepID=A0AAD2K6L0_9AGAR|nr:unnamed protein product [Mycena citricolor]